MQLHNKVSGSIVAVSLVLGLAGPLAAFAEEQMTPSPESFSVAAETSGAISINADMGLVASETPSTSCPSGTLIKGSASAVYYCGADGKRYVFTNDKAYFTWYPDFSTVTTISDEVLGSITIGGNVTYKPGVKLVKIESDPKVYAIAKDGTLRWVSSEAIAVSLYGDDWNDKVDDIADAFFVNYTIGAAITAS